MASYSAVTAQNIPVSPGIQSGVSSTVNRKKTVRFKFDPLPDKKDFLRAVLNVLDHEHVKCIQTLPGGRVDLTVRHDDNVADILHSGIDLHGETWFPKPLGFDTTYAYVQYLPSEMSSVQVGEAMTRYGRVFSVKRQLYDGTTIETGTRIVSLEVTSPIPSYVFLGGYRAKIWHRGQVQTCAKCSATDHFARDCPRNQFSTNDMNTPLDASRELEVNTTVKKTEAIEKKEEIKQEPPPTTQEEENDDSDSCELTDYFDEYSEYSDEEYSENEDHAQAEEGDAKAQQDGQDQHQDVVLDNDLEVNRPIKRALAPSTPTKKPGQKPPSKRRKKKDKNKTTKGKNKAKAKLDLSK